VLLLVTSFSIKYQPVLERVFSSWSKKHAPTRQAERFSKSSPGADARARDDLNDKLPSFRHKSPPARGGTLSESMATSR
jgi:hypothetical protein